MIESFDNDEFREEREKVIAHIEELCVKKFMLQWHNYQLMATLELRLRNFRRKGEH